MRLFIDKASGNCIPAANEEGAVATTEAPIAVRGGSSIPIEIQFVDRATPDALQTGIRYPTGAAIQWTLKLVGKFTGDTLLAVDSFTRPSADDGYYTATLNTNSEDVLTALADLDGNANNDAASISVAGEITILLSGADEPIRTQHIHLSVENFYTQTGDTFTLPTSIVTETSTGRTLALTDAGKWIRCTNDTSCTIVVPLQAAVPWTGFPEITIEAATSAVVAISGPVASLNAWVNSAGSSAVMKLKRVAEDTWILYGDLQGT